MSKAPNSDRRSFLDVAGKIGAGLIANARVAGIAAAQVRRTRVLFELRHVAQRRPLIFGVAACA